MAKYFNTAGPCDPGKHYMLPPESRLPKVERLVAQERYFVVHAPRQAGKTTALEALVTRLTASGRYTALLTSCETGQALGADLEGAVAAVLDVLRLNAELRLPEELRPPPPSAASPPRSRVQDLLVRWARQSPRPLVLVLDEIDALRDDVLLALLRQLRSGYSARPEAYPQSIILAGLRDVRDYRIGDGETLGTASPFNVKSDSLTLEDFTPEEVAELYGQHTAETGQAWEDGAVARAWELTRGQPWLVNAIAREVVEELCPDPSRTISAAAVDRAREVLIERRDTHLDSLVDRLREERVRRVVAPILAGELLASDVLHDDVRFVTDLGLVRSSPTGGLEIANPIYREIVPRALTEIMEKSLVLPRPSYVDATGRLDFAALLGDFRSFWLENAEAFLERAPYHEAAAQLVFMAFLHKVVNGKGWVDREYAVGRGRLDLSVRWPLPGGGFERFALELKVWRDGQADPVAKGLDQLVGYLERLDLESGTLVVFDGRSAAPPLPERVGSEEVVHQGRRVLVLVMRL